MSSYSYADPVLGMVVLRIPAEIALSNDLLPAGALTREQIVELAERREQVALHLHSSLFFHEWAHTLQVAAYPNLYRRAAVQARPIGAYWNTLRGRPQEWQLPLNLQLRDDYVMMSMLGTVAARLEINDRGVGLTPVPEGTLRRGVLTENDLVEEDAQVLQYRVEIGGAGSGRSYRRWLSEGQRYSRAFSILSQHMSDGQALRLLPRMVRAAFHTTRPLNAFASLLGTILHEGPDLFSDLDDAFSRTLLVDHLQGVYGDVDQEWADIRKDEPERLAVVSPERHRALVENTPHLPVRWYAGWNADPATGGFLDKYLATPWKYTGRGGDRLDDELSRFQPPLLLVLVDHPDRNLAAQTVKVSPSLKDLESEELGVSVRTLLMEVFRSKLLSDTRLAVRPPFAACPHATCPYHPTRLCDGWIPLPKRQEDCLFPEYLRGNTGHTLDQAGKHLVPLTERPD
ncbi:hypothetical protein [Kribbella sancticallisti]